MTDDEAIAKLTSVREDALATWLPQHHISLDRSDGMALTHAIDAIETLAKARALLNHTERTLTVLGIRRAISHKLVAELLELLEAKP